MQKTLVKKSGFLREKAKFFLFRGFSYFSFLMLPIYLQNQAQSSIIVSLIGLVIYNIFMVSQWYFLGKEIDHRLKVYIEVNSSIDRIIERTLLGLVAMILYFNLLSLFSEASLSFAFWSTWVVTGLFYSWPTRGRIIQESITYQMREFRYLDAFAKTTLFCAFFMFMFSIPELPLFSNIEALKLYIDPAERVHSYFWNFTYVNFFPFVHNDKIFSLAWSLSFYFWGAGIFLISFYALTRFLVSRRLSLLATFGLISSWSFVLMMGSNYFDIIHQAYIVLWIWSLLMVSKSSVYRSGLVFGLINFFGVTFNPYNIILLIFGLVFIYFEVLKEKNSWYRKQFLKYSTLGVVLSLLTVKTNHGFDFAFDSWDIKEFLNLNKKLISRKAFYALSVFGLIPIVALIFKSTARYVRYFDINTKALNHLCIALVFCLALSFSINQSFFKDYGIIWVYPLLTIISLEWIFQSMRRFRSRRNLTYSVYFLICLLDSHFELRIAGVINFFSSESFIAFMSNP